MMLERDRDLAVLRRALAPGRPGSSRLAVVAGVPGIGRTSLARAAVESEPTVLWANCTAPGMRQPHGVLQQWTADLAALFPDGGGQTLHRLLAQRADITPELLVEGLRVAAGRVGRVHRVVLVVEDAHWADPDSAALLAAVLPHLPEPVAALVTVADGAIPSPLQAVLVAAHAVVRPRPLSLAAVTALVTERDAAERIHALSGGIPAHVAELITARERTRAMLAAFRGTSPEWHRPRLSVAERRVVELACRGMTNREIAQALYVTVKTVEFHLSRSYRKLGVAGRQELGRVLAGPAPTG